MKVTDHEIRIRLRDVETPRLKRLLKLYPNDRQALPLIRAELKRRTAKRSIF